MKKRVFAIVLIAIFVFTSTVGIYARSRSFGGSRSFSKSYSRSYKGSSSSGGWFGSSSTTRSSSPKSSSSKSSSSKSSSSKSSSSKSSSSKSSSSKSSSSTGSATGGGSTGSSLFGSTKSKSNSTSSTKSSGSRSIPGTSKTYTGSSSSGAKSFATKSASKKYSYMQDTYKKQTSGKNFNTYKQKLNTEQQKVYNDSMKRDYGTSSRRMKFEDAMNTRTTRINTFGKRPIFINVNTSMFGSPFSYGYAYVGPWDMWFLMRASEMFWYNHWHDIAPYRSYFNDQEFDRLERRVQELESQGVQRDPNYIDPDADPDLQFSQQYQEENVDKIYYTDKNPTGSTGGATAVIMIIVLGVVLVIVIRHLSKPKPKQNHYSRIY